jgi:LPXTG-motif cell wall-anchored protein
MGWFGSENESNTNAPNNSITASDQALVNAPRRSGNTNVSLKLGKGATYAPQFGVGGDELQAFGNSLLAGLADMGGSPSNRIEQAAGERAAEQAIEAPKAATQLGKANWILIAVGAVLLVGVVFLKRKKKTS